MSKFKPGDKVTPVNAYSDNDIMEQFVGKTLLVLSVGDEIVCAGVPGEGDWYWHPDDLRLVSETQPEQADAAPSAVAEGPELTPYQIACDMFKPGDKIMILSADPMYPAYKRKTVGTVQTIVAISYVTPQPIHAEINGEIYSCGWMPHEVRLATPEEIAADGVAPKPKPIRRGDLVMCRGQIGVVHDTDPDGENGYWVAALTGDGSCVWRCAEDLTRIGSIRKKIKRIKNEMESRK